MYGAQQCVQRKLNTHGKPTNTHKEQSNHHIQIQFIDSLVYKTDCPRHPNYSWRYYALMIVSSFYRFFYRWPNSLQLQRTQSPSTIHIRARMLWIRIQTCVNSVWRAFHIFHVYRRTHIITIPHLEIFYAIGQASTDVSSMKKWFISSINLTLFADRMVYAKLFWLANGFVFCALDDYMVREYGYICFGWECNVSYTFSFVILHLDSFFEFDFDCTILNNSTINTWLENLDNILNAEWEYNNYPIVQGT